MRALIFIIIVFFTINSTFATHLYYSEHVCPICKTKATFSKIETQNPNECHQYTFWVFTETYSINCCMNCHFSTFNFDFDSVPKNKIDKINSFLKIVHFNVKYKNYLEIPVTKKLEIAEKIYRILGRNGEFWCHFYRNIGYCYSMENKQRLAMEARFKSLLYAHMALKERLNKGKEKEILYIIAAMNYFTGQEKQALSYLERAKRYKYINTAISKDNSDAIDKYLSGLIDEYPKFISEQRNIKNKK